MTYFCVKDDIQWEKEYGENSVYPTASDCIMKSAKNACLAVDKYIQ